MTQLQNLSKEKNFLRKTMWSFLFGSGVCFTMERMMGPGMVNMMIAAAKELYPDDPEKQIELCQNHCIFFNTQPTVGIIVPGIVLGLEMERAKTNEIPNELIQSVKTALAGPFAGIGDSLIQGLLIPILLSIAISLSDGGSVIGVLFLIGAYFLICYPLTWSLFKTGVQMGINGAERIISSGIKDRLISAVEILGILVVGAVTASTANVTTGLSFTFGELVIDVQSLLDKVYPGLLTIVALGGTLWLIRKKKVTPLKIMGLFLILSTIGYFTGILV